MIFDALYESSQRGELLLIEGGFCHWHLRKDGQLTIREIIATRKGAGTEMLNILIKRQPASIVAKCPHYLAANAWYVKKGFVLNEIEQSKSGQRINVWKLSFAPAATDDTPK